MKILLVKSTSGYTDLQKAITYNIQETGLAGALNRLGHQCDVVFPGRNEYKEVKVPYNDKGYTFTVYYLKQKSFMRDNIYMGINALAQNYDIIHSGGYDTIQSWRFSRKFPEKVVIYNGTYYSDFNKKYNLKCRLIDCLFVPTYRKKKITFDTKSRMSEMFLRGKGLNDVTSVGVGIDLNRIEYKAEEDHELIEQLKKYKEEGKKLILYIGRIEPRRNIHFLLDVVKEVAKTDNVKFIMIGNQGPQHYKDSVFNYINENNLSDVIEYRTFLDQKYLRSVYKQCDVFLLPTIYEIFGMVLLEAMYYRVPVITTLNGGSDLLIKNNVNGYIEENNNLQAWSDRVHYIFTHSDEARGIGEKAHETISNEYTWDALALKFIKIFQKKLSYKHNE